MNIVLIGYRCSGKTSVGKILAKELGRFFWDTDKIIENGMESSISGYVSEYGWDRFREMEKQVVKEVIKNDNLVVATGGGIVMDLGNVRKLKENGWVVWLNADEQVIRERMEKAQKAGKIWPSLTETNALDEIENLVKIRNPYYERTADFIVDTSTYSLQQVSDLIVKRVSQI
jgi:shikimate kinase